MPNREQQPDSFEQNLQDVFGLTRNKEGQLEFRMPVRPKEVDGMMEFTFATLIQLLNTKKIKTGIKFIATKHIIAYGVSIAAEQLLDTALADMMDAIGDVDYNEAVRSLNFAQNAPTKKEQREHRDRAQGFLQSAYGNYDSIIQEREKNTFTNNIRKNLRKFFTQNKKDIELHGKAARTALIVAFMDHSKRYASTQYWTDTAKRHFEKYFSYKNENEEARNRHISHLEGLLQRYRHYPYVVIGRNHYVEKRVSKNQIWKEIQEEKNRYDKNMAQLNQQQQQFNQLHAHLISPR